MPVQASQYLVPEGIGLDAAVARVTAGFEVVSGPAETVERTFYDTFDGRLHAAGLVLIAAGGRLVAARGPSYLEVAAAAGPAPERLFAGDLAAGSLRSLVAPVVDVRALAPIARIRGRARSVRVLNGDAKTVVRLVVESAAAVDGDGRGDEVPLGMRVHVIGVRGYDRARGRVERALAERIGWAQATGGLHEEAVRAGGGRPGGFSGQLDPRLVSGAEPAAAGTAIVLESMAATIEATLPGALADVDSEFLHDLRVAVRRTRSIARQLAGVFPPDRLPRFREEFRWLGQVTGPTRDLDVLLLDFARLRAGLPADRAAELGPLNGLLRARRAEELGRMADDLGSPRTRALLDDWSALLAELRAGGGGGDGGRGDGGGPGGGGGGGGPAGQPLRELVGRRIRVVYRRMRRAGAAIDAMTPAEQLHDLRKQGKELRYLLEVFGGLFAAEAVGRTVKRLKALQETLGEFQDREVQATTLRSLGTELAGVEGGPAALLALGPVLERVQAESRSARADFAERFAGFTTPAERAVIRESFG
jgi:CHAD domain-containing protein